MHVAAIMDGNRRWGKAHGLSTLEGHRAGITKAIEIVKFAEKVGIKFMTLYAFSKENWNRSVEEVSGLMYLFEHYLINKCDELAEKDVKIKFIGNFDRVPPKLKKGMSNVEAKTNSNTGVQLFLGIGYGGRDEIVNAAKKLARLYKDGRCALDEVDEDFFKTLLYAGDVPYPDLLIRTGGVYRISNFLLWQAAYTEFYFTKTFWPEFSVEELQEAITQFKGRDRRYGR